MPAAAGPPGRAPRRRPLTRAPRYRSVGSVGYALAYLLTAAAYLVAPPTATPRPGVVSIARYINTLGPVWTSAFGLVAAALVAAVLLRRREWLAHCLAAAVIAGYGVAALTSGVLSDNIYGSPLAFLCAATACQHLVMARGYQTTSVEAG